MSGPVRIQRKRTKGWRMPEGAVYVGRPSRWGNPFWVVGELVSVDLSLTLYRDAVNGIWNPGLFYDQPTWMRDNAHYDLMRWRERLGGHPTELARTELAGRDLACWCPLDQPCHADVLLEVANG